MASLEKLCTNSKRKARGKGNKTRRTNANEKKTQNLRAILDFLAEVNVLKGTLRVGWRHAGPPLVAEQDPVASHVMLVAQLAYLLARLERMSQKRALRCVGMALFHDNEETRIGDLDKIATRYLEKKQVISSDVMWAQTKKLPQPIGMEIREFALEANFGKTPESVIVRDADNLEVALQSLLFHQRGFRIPNHVLKQYLNVERVQTKSAKSLMRVLLQTKNLSVNWWKELFWGDSDE